MEAVFTKVFDQAVVFHSFTAYMRDYEILVYATADPRTGIQPEHVRLLFRHCVRVTTTTALEPGTWSVSLDERLIDHGTGVDLDGYVWGVSWQLLYPGVELVVDSAEAAEWSSALDLPFYEAKVGMNGHNISLVFSDLEVSTVPFGYSPFVVPRGGPDVKVPLP